MRSVSWLRAVSRITGIGQRAWIARHSSSPPMPGSITSSTTRSGDSRSTSPVDLAAVAGRDDAETVARQVLADDVADGRLVVDDEHGTRALHAPL